AYVSDEGGRSDVFVQPYPATGGKWQISKAGGSQPRWRRDGRELFFVALDNKLMTAPIAAGAGFEAGVPAALFETRMGAPVNYGFKYSPSADGRRFLMLESREDSTPVPATVVLNWTAGLK
ncbi:MAG: hypothetical protein ACRD96_22175, partial [Bryobacteraceae bacterium]